MPELNYDGAAVGGAPAGARQDWSITGPPLYRYLAWATVPLLALVGYAPVLGIGFLSDDLPLLDTARQTGIDLTVFWPYPGAILYRPVGGLLTWQLGWQFWGFQPLPYHLLGWLIHAGTALALTAWLTAATGQRDLGWLAGALFAVFPLHGEAVGWLAAQWDAWAAFFGLGGLWLFTRWWQGGRPGLLGGAVLGYGLSIFSKESLFLFLPMFALTAWLAAPPPDGAAWRRLGWASLPFAAVLLLNIGVRLVAWGRLGNYPGARVDYLEFAWDGFLAAGHLLLAPINGALVGAAPVQGVGLAASAAWFAGLLWLGRAHRRLLLVVAAWIVLAVLPVLNLLPGADPDLQQSRYLYLAAAGYCSGAAVLLGSLRDAAGRGRGAVQAGIFALLLAATGMCWVQLQPWLTATAQTGALVAELHRLLPAQPPEIAPAWYVQNTPDSYKGAYMFRLGLNVTRYYSDGESPWVRRAPVDAPPPLADNTRNAFALRFREDPATAESHVETITGISAGSTTLPLPAADTVAAQWDFQACPAAGGSDGTVAAVPPAICGSHQGLVIPPDAGNPRLITPAIHLAAGPGLVHFLRVRAAFRYPAQAGSAPTQQWAWQAHSGAGEDPMSLTLPVRQDGLLHTYWAIVALAPDAGPLTGLRFTLPAGASPVTLAWLVVELI